MPTPVAANAPRPTLPATPKPFFFTGLGTCCDPNGTENNLIPIPSCPSAYTNNPNLNEIGFDGIAIANHKSGPEFKLTLRDLYLALAKDVPADPQGKEVKPNPYKKWSEVNPALPDLPILVLGPPPTSGTRDAFNELAIERGCKTFPERKILKKEKKT